MYRWPLGRQTSCPVCGGAGYSLDGKGREVFCECDAGGVRRAVELDGIDWDDACVNVTGRRRGPAEEGGG